MRLMLAKTVATTAMVATAVTLTACGSDETTSATSATSSTTSSGTTSSGTTSDSTAIADRHGRGGDHHGGRGGHHVVTTITSVADLDALVTQAAGNAERGLHGGHHDIQTVLTDVLGLTHEQLHTRMDDGQNLAAIAEDLDVKPSALIDALTKQAKTLVDQAKTDEIITAKQATEYVEKLRQAYTERVNSEG